MDIFSPQTRQAHRELVDVLRYLNDQELVKRKEEERRAQASRGIRGRLGRIGSKGFVYVSSVGSVILGATFSLSSGVVLMLSAGGVEVATDPATLGAMLLTGTGAGGLGFALISAAGSYNNAVSEPQKERLEELEVSFFSSLIKDLRERGFTVLSYDINNFSVMTHRGVAMAITEEDGSLALILNGQPLVDSYAAVVEAPTRQVTSVSGSRIAVSTQATQLALTS